MRVYSIHHIDSFAREIFGGNPTVTVLGADSLNEQEMKKIAREMNLSETGFVLSSKKADFRLRFFTPSGDEVKFCGHATLGALRSIAYEGLFGCHKAVRTHLFVETNAGILEMDIDMLDHENPSFIFDSPKIEVIPSPFSIQELVDGTGIGKGLIDETKPVMLETTNNYLYLAAKSLDSLSRINPDMRLTTEFCKKDRVVVLCILSNETVDQENQLHSRGFAPLVGVPEDPFTGSMQGGAVAYALKNGMIAPDRKWVGAEQGHFIGRPGKARLEITNHNPVQVKIHAQAAHVYTSKLHLP